MLRNMPSDRRVITDPKWIRAMAHPLRWQILDLLRADGPLTATQVSDAVGESPANCSFHLRTLAKYGFIEEAGGGTGRNRPWKAADIAVEVIDDPDSAPIEGAKALREIVRGRAFKAIEAWELYDTFDYPSGWRRAAMEAEWELPLTLDELRELQAEIKQVVARYGERDKAPDGAIRARVFAWAFPTGDPAKATATRRRKASKSARPKKSAGKEIGK